MNTMLAIKSGAMPPISIPPAKQSAPTTTATSAASQVIAAPTPTIGVNYGNGNNINIVPQGPSTIIKPTSGPITIDIDGDGKPDITVTPDPNQTKPVGVDINGDGTIDFMVQGQITANPSKGKIGLDLDGDGKPDITYAPPTETKPNPGKYIPPELEQPFNRGPFL